MSVLVIDDEDLIRNLATRILQRAGIDAIAADSGPAGLAIVAQQPASIKLTVVDFSMPGMSGIETVRELRQLAPDMPCIFSSGYPIGENEIPAEIRKRTAYLQKPYRSQNLLEVVTAMLPKLEPQPK